jgi:hypothetical protein
VPVITLINVGGYRHFVIIKGMDDNNILMGDPVFWRAGREEGDLHQGLGRRRARRPQ